MRIIRILVAALITVLGAGQAYAQVNASNWTFRYSNGVNQHPRQDGTAAAFQFPQGTGCGNRNCNHVDYLTEQWNNAISGSMSMTFTIGSSPTGSPATFGYHTESFNTCVFPASVRFLIEKPNDGALTDPNGRFWSNPMAVQLGLGTFTLTVPLNSSNWTNVNGQQNSSAFGNLIHHPGNIGMTFGGGCFFGHGVYVAPNQDVWMKITSFTP